MMGELLLLKIYIVLRAWYEIFYDNRQVFPWGYSCESVLGSWGVRSTARDVLKFLKANILLHEYSTNAGLMDALELSKMKFILLHGVCK